MELRKGKDITIFATGLCVSETLKAAETLAENGIDAQVINIHTIKPLDEELVLKAAKQTGRVYTVEEHSIIGGLGSAVAELLGEKRHTQGYERNGTIIRFDLWRSARRTALR